MGPVPSTAPKPKEVIMAKNGTAQATAAAATEDREWEDLKKQIRETAFLLGGLLFTPFIFFLGAVYGVRAGIFAGLKKTLEMLKAWNG
jgi:hypothetical protein